MFVELLGRSCFSFLQGASHPEEMVTAAHHLGLSGFALCDVDGIYGAVRGWKASKELPLQFLVGAELTLANAASVETLPIAEEGTSLTVVLLIQSIKGYETLCRLLTKSHEGQQKGSCVCDVSWFDELNQDLHALVIPPKDPRCFSWNREESFEERLNHAFKDRISVVSYRHLDGLDRLREAWSVQLAKRLNAPIVASARPLFHDPERKPLSDVLHCIRNHTTLDNAGSTLSKNGEAHLRSEQSILQLFRDRPEWVHRSGAIAQSCQFDFSELSYSFPCELTEGESADERLRRLCFEGVKRRFREGISASLHEQIEKELHLIQKIGVAPYFLSTYDIVEIAREKKILCQGRGSAANSAVCFMLGITAVDPARSNLLFERFLSEERAEPPDIDIDFEHERREEVIQEIYKRYGRERAAMVSEIITYRRKSALREVSKVFGLSLEQADRLSGTVTWEQSPEAEERKLSEAGFDLNDPRLKQVIALADCLKGFPRHLSIHVGGFVLSSRPLYEVAPIEPAKMEGRTVIPWDKDDIDALGFFKVDVLALGMLTAIRKTLQLIRESGGLVEKTDGLSASISSTEEEFDPLEVITRIPAKDQPTYRMISQGDTVGVFQIESRAQMAMLPRLRPSCFYDLVIEVAIVRPGPIQGGMVHPFLRRRNNEEAVTCPHPDLWPILKRTLGVPLFQEQVMQIAIEGAGYSGGEADQLRRDMAAWKKHGRLLEHRQRLLSGFRKKGISPQFGEALFEQIKGFGEYGFPESHASSFALLVYSSSWQKRHYPAHFTCSLLNSQPMGFYQPTSLIQDAQRHGVEVRDVDIERSDWDCTLEPIDLGRNQIKSGAVGADRALRLGFRMIKGLGKSCALRICSARGAGTFTSISDLTRRASLKKDECEALAESGALTVFTPERRQALWQIRAPHTPGLFSTSPVGEPQVKLPTLSAAEQLILDYGRKGLSVSDHPFRHYRKKLRKLGAARASDLIYLPRGQRVSVAGLVMARQRPATASGVVFMTLEDETGSANLIIYSKTFEQYERVARHSSMLLVHGTIERDSRLPIQTHSSGLPSDDEPVPVLHVLVRHLERFGNETSDRLSGLSRDFH
jgi:error-prone DNA polymerase